MHCSRHGREADLPIVKFKQLCCTENGHLLNDPAGSRREAVSFISSSEYMTPCRLKGRHINIILKERIDREQHFMLLSHELLKGNRYWSILLTALAPCMPQWLLHVTSLLDLADGIPHIRDTCKAQYKLPFAGLFGGSQALCARQLVLLLHPQSPARLQSLVGVQEAALHQPCPFW